MNIDKELYLDVRSKIYEIVDVAVINQLTDDELKKQVNSAVHALSGTYGVPIPSVSRDEITELLVDEFKGLGPLEKLVSDNSISDIMVNGYKDIFYERNGLIQKSPVHFINEQQLIEIAKRIASKVGRRVDESMPLVDARLEDGSRVNIVIPPIAIDGTSISIRKFREQKIGLADLVDFGSLSMPMARFLMIAARCRINIIISGGTGSGKTTLLSALSNYIGDRERIVTIEDAAELVIAKENVVRLETRSKSMEGSGEIVQRDLVINALRMRPDRIILGECRGAEAFEMLQAMNTGHDGSMSTLHANTPRDAMSRIESMVLMANLSLPLLAIRKTIVSAVNLIVQVNRLRDGSRKVTSITEISGLEGETPIMEELFHYKMDDKQIVSKKISGTFVSNKITSRSKISTSAVQYGLKEQLAKIYE